MGALLTKPQSVTSTAVSYDVPPACMQYAYATESDTSFGAPCKAPEDKWWYSVHEKYEYLEGLVTKWNAEYLQTIIVKRAAPRVS